MSMRYLFCDFVRCNDVRPWHSSTRHDTESFNCLYDERVGYFASSKSQATRLGIRILISKRPWNRDTERELPTMSEKVGESSREAPLSRRMAATAIANTILWGNSSIACVILNPPMLWTTNTTCATRPT